MFRQCSYGLHYLTSFVSEMISNNVVVSMKQQRLISLNIKLYWLDLYKYLIINMVYSIVLY